jgi:hypothetical protein
MKARTTKQITNITNLRYMTPLIAEALSQTARHVAQTCSLPSKCSAVPWQPRATWKMRSWAGPYFTSWTGSEDTGSVAGEAVTCAVSESPLLFVVEVMIGEAADSSGRASPADTVSLAL